MNNAKRVLIPLLLTLLLLGLLWLTACRDKPAETTEEGTQAPPEKVEILTGVELATNETPVILLPSGNDEPETGTEDGKPASTTKKPPASTAPTSSSSVPWTGPRETPIIKVKPSTTTENTTDQP